MTLPPPPPPALDKLQALVFDVFGTLADWRTGIAREAHAALAAHGVVVDGAAFADGWRAQYQPAMEAVRSGRLPFCKLDVLHRRNLDRVLIDFGLDDLPDTARANLNLAWHRLDGWPDVGPALARLRQRFLIAPCSNGNVSLMVDLARRNAWHWDAILGAEIARDYKPKLEVYRAAASAFDCAPEQVLMVAAHSSDLAAATQAGLRTAFVARPDENGPGRGERESSVVVDLSANDLGALADRLLGIIGTGPTATPP